MAATTSTIRLRAESSRRMSPPSTGMRGRSVATDPATLGTLVARVGEHLVAPRRHGVDDVIRALTDLQLGWMALDLVEAHVADEARVLDREVPGRLVRIGVEVLMPRPDRRREQRPLLPVDALLGLALVVDERVAAALDDVDHGLGRVAMAHGVAARRQLGEMRREDAVLCELEPEALVVAPWPLEDRKS